MEKEVTLAEQAALENEEFERIVAHQKAADELGRDKLKLEKERRLRNQNELKAQIEQVEEQHRKERRGFLEEGNALKAVYHEHDLEVESIRQRKLNELRGGGVPEKYANEILKKKNIEPLRPSK